MFKVKRVLQAKALSHDILAGASKDSREERPELRLERKKKSGAYASCFLC